MQKKRKKEFRKLMIEEEMEIARIVEEIQEKEKYLIKIMTVEEMVLRRFHKYLKVLEKKESERMLTRKIWNYTIDLREGFVLKKEKKYLLSRIEREEVQEFLRDQLRKGYIWLLKLLQTLLVFLVPKKDGIRLLIFEQLDNQEQLSIATDFRFDR